MNFLFIMFLRLSVNKICVIVVFGHVFCFLSMQRYVIYFVRQILRGDINKMQIKLYLFAFFYQFCRLNIIYSNYPACHYRDLVLALPLDLSRLP